MGCGKSKEQSALESELERLQLQKQSLESELNTYKQQPASENSSSLSSDLFKFIDQDQFTTLKTFEVLFSTLSTDIHSYQIFNQKYQSLSSLDPYEKIVNYGELRIQETDLQKKLVSKFQEQFKDIAEVVTNKFCALEERIEKIETLFGDSEDFEEDRKWVWKKMKEVQNSGKQDLDVVVKNFKVLEEVEKKVVVIERRLPKLQNDEVFVGELKELEASLVGLVKASLLSLSSIESVFGEISVQENFDVAGLKSAELNFQTFSTLFSTLSDQIKALQSLESFKADQIQVAPMTEKLKSIEKSLTRYLINSEQHKSTTHARLRRVTRGSNELTSISKAVFQGLSQGKRTVAGEVQFLEHKVASFLDSLQAQDQLLLEMTEKFNSVDQILDEIELKFQEFLSAEVKALHKVSFSDIHSIKQSLDAVNDKIIEYNEQAHKDLAERLEFFLSKVKITEDLQSIKIEIRDAYSKEILKIKSEMQERVNELSTQVSALESENSHLNNSLTSTKAQLSLTTEITDTLMKSVNEKELFVTDLKNTIASLQEQLEVTIQEKSILDDEVGDLRKEIRECKKTLRTKEHELEELKEHLKPQ